MLAAADEAGATCASDVARRRTRPPSDVAMGRKNKRKAEKAEPEEGPPRVEGGMRTTSASLQAKLDELFTFAAKDERENFVRAFVPLDLSDGELATYLGDLTTGEEAEGAWANLAAEIETIASGECVWKIDGDQASRAVFYFPHPLIPNCDREVEFKCVGGEWRADG